MLSITEFSLIEVIPTVAKARNIIEFLTKYHTTDSKYFPVAGRLFDKFTYYEATDRDLNIVGYTAYSASSDWLAMTHTTCIHPDHRRKGYGRVITDMMENFLVQKEFGKITCEIYADNHHMLRLKLSQGYTIEGFHKSHYDPGKDEYSLGKLIREDTISKR